MLASVGGCYTGPPLSLELNELGAGSGGQEDAGTGGDTDGGGEEPPGVVECVAEAAWAGQLLQDRCGGCHGPGSNGAGGFDYVDDLTRLVTSQLLVPGDPAGSPIWARMDGGSMPPGGPAVPTDEVERLADYIADCADVPQAQCQDNQSPDYYEQLELVAKDVSTLDLDDRPFTRYLSLAHRHAAGFCEDELDIYRAALAKSVNALSREPTLATPVPIDPQDLIYRIDLRDYGWGEPFGEFRDKWEAVVAATPYAIERFEDDAETIKTFTDATVPMLMADAFLDAVSRPPLYHDLAGIPSTRAELESLLGVDLDADVAALEVARAGVADSSMAHNNRIVQRHDLPTGAGHSLWLGYEVDDDAASSQNVYASPLDFQATIQTLIFSLPNGLHGYMMVDAQGSRIDVAPDDVLVDAAQPDGNMRTGISCVRCHDGLQPAIDVVRDHVLTGVDFDAQTKDAVDDIYPPAADLEALLEQDLSRYHDALVGVGVDPTAKVEPISESVARFELNVELEQAAAELGIADTTLLTQLGGLDPTLSPLANGAVKREVWSSLFPEVVCALNLGRPAGGSCGADDGGDGSDGLYGPCDSDGDCEPSETCISDGQGSICAPSPCVTDDDCPASEQGGTPVCSLENTNTGLCILSCHEDAECPAAATCSMQGLCVF